MQPTRTIFTFSISVAISFALTAQAADPIVSLPAPNDSGWINLFRGNNDQDFYSHDDKNKRGPFPNATFQNKDSLVSVSGTPTGHFAFRQPFSYYHLRFKMKHVTDGNAGALLHTREDENGLGVYPRSLELQGNSYGMGELWTIGDVWVELPVVDPSARPPVYKEGGIVIQHGNNNDRQCRGSSNPMKPMGQWDVIEAYVYGADSVRHVVNGITTISYKKIRVSPSIDDFTKPLNSGVIAWQSEGAVIWYKDLEVKLMPKDPIYAAVYKGTTIIKAENILHRSSRQAAPTLLHDLMGRINAKGKSIKFNTTRLNF